MSEAREDIAVKVDNVVKDFTLNHEKSSSLKSSVVNVFKKKTKLTTEEYRALRGVSFEIKKGEFFGIVGRNGSGKSTLLKIIAEIYQPTSGKVTVQGRLVPFIELGVGFNPELTGRENVFLNGALLGFSRKEMEEKYDDIVEFAELEQFMDQKLKNYSSGMQVRLAFSVAIRADADILLIDEVLAVGDEAFQRKCLSYFAKLKREKKTVVFVTHSMEAVQQFCDRAILIDKGHKSEIGSPLRISQIYRELNDQDSITVNRDDNNSQTTTKYIDAHAKHTVRDGKRVFDISIKPKQPMDDPVFAVGIYSETGEEVYRWASDEKLAEKFDPQVHRDFEIEVLDIFPVGVFDVNLYIKKRDRSREYAIFNAIAKFEVKNLTPYERDIRWKIPDKVSINGEEVENVHRR